MTTELHATNATNELKTRLQKLQNTCIRYIFGVRRSVHVTPYRQQLGWMRTDTRRTYFSAVLLYIVLNFGAPSYLLHMFNKRPSNRPARSVSGDLLIPRVYSEYGSRTFRFQGVKLWNSLLHSIKYQPSLARFKSALKNYLLDLD